MDKKHSMIYWLFVAVGVIYVLKMMMTLITP